MRVAMSLAITAAVAIAACGDDGRPPTVTIDAGAQPREDACAACPVGMTCSAGVCACEGTLTPCGDTCVDLQSSADHCGACEIACAPGSPCRAGVCACAPPLAACLDVRGDEECVELATDTSHCGTCGNRCAAGATCEGGTCACDVGETSCMNDDGRYVCVDPMTSVLHCGRCGYRCGVGSECIRGACACPAGRVPCPDPAGGADRCADLATDDANCGGCGAPCETNEVCLGGTCVDSCAAGTECTRSEHCRGTLATLPETGGAACIPQSDEVVTVGDVTWTQTSWAGGYCLQGYGGDDASGRCDPAQASSCDPCSRCVPVGDHPTLGRLNACLRRCDPGMGDWRTTRAGCREGYQCHLEQELCVPGCSADEQCRASFVDTNGNLARDPGETTIDPTSVARCDHTTGRCVDLPFDGDARIGSACTTAADCPEEATCIPSWPGGGYCTRLACLLEGRGCGDGASCLAPWGTYTYGWCLDDCTVGDETDPSVVIGTTTGGDPDCRAPGYRCQTLDGSARGGCVPGLFNDVAEPNVGVECTSDDECWSPYGGGGCYRLRGRGFCVVTQCANPAFALMEPGQSVLCPAGTICEGIAREYSYCIPTCDPAMGAAACREGYNCVEMGDPRANVCFPRCRSAELDCFPGDVCDDGNCHAP